MKIVQYFLKSDNKTKRTRHVGIRIGEEIIDFKTMCKDLPDNLIQILHESPYFIPNLKEQEDDEDLINSYLAQAAVSLADVDLIAPISNPDKVICTGMNYKDHCEEQNAPVPKEPLFFTKFPSNLIGPFDPIRYPSVTQQLDYEVELAFIIGKEGKNIPIEQAMEYVLGYTVAHDVSARDWQFNRNGGQWTMGKVMDDFCPIGPEIVTTNDLTDPHSLPIRCRVNGIIKQDSNTNQLIHRIDAIIAFLSKTITLLPGDVILTGTPPGVGVFQTPQCFLKKGDVVECEIEGIGTIRNKVV